MKKRLITAILLMIPFLSSAQYLEIGPLGGVTYYMGDLNPKIHFNMSKPAFGAIIRYNFNSRFAMRANFIIGSISGDDIKTKAVANRKLHFTSNINEISLQGELHFFNYRTGSERYRFTPYLFGGIGMMMFNPQATIHGEVVNLRDLGTEGQFSSVYPERDPYNLTQICIPFGIGIKLSFFKVLSLTVEWGMRKMFTDYLDDCSSTYYLNNDITNFSNSAAMASDPTMNHHYNDKRGETQFKDWYNFTGVSLTYKINFRKSSTCDNFNGKKYYQ